MIQKPKKIFLDSRNATLANGMYTFTLTSAINIYNYISLQCFQCLNNFWNVQSSSSWIDVSYNGTTTSLQFPLGNWSIDDLVTELQTLLQTVNSGFTVTYVSAISQLQFQNSNGNFQFLFGSGPNKANSMWCQLGFLQQDTTSTNNLFAPNVPSLNGPEYLYIRIDDIGDCPVKSSQPSYDSTFVIPFSLSKGSVETWNCNTSFPQITYLASPELNLTTIELSFYTNMQNVGFSNYQFYGYPFLVVFEYQ